jgi:chemotaxis protein methyltransferase CheR
MQFEEFLREATCLLGLQSRPFQRRGIKRRLEKRIVEIGLSDFGTYLSRVKENREEQRNLSRILTVTISRFFRDKEVFDLIGTSLIPGILEKKDKRKIKIWSIGCASGEEPFSLSILRKEKGEDRWPQADFSVIATDIDESLIERAKAGRYKKSSLQEVPEEILRRFFKREGESFLLNPSIRESVEFLKHDILREEPLAGIDIVFCRNLAFTYFSKESQVAVLRKMAASLEGRGYLVIGKSESLPLTYPALFVPAFLEEKVFQKFIPMNASDSRG